MHRNASLDGHAILQRPTDTDHGALAHLLLESLRSGDQHALLTQNTVVVCRLGGSCFNHRAVRDDRAKLCTRLELNDVRAKEGALAPIRQC